MHCARMFFLFTVFSTPVVAQQVGVSTIAPVSEATLRLANKPRDPTLEAAVRRVRADPYPDASTLHLLKSIKQQEDHEWQQAFARDMENAFRQDADKVSVPHEYPPNPYDMPDGFGIVQWLANAAIRAKLPCGSIYTVNSVGEGKRGWRLSCDQGAHNYTITLVGKEWKLGAKR